MMTWHRITSAAIAHYRSLYRDCASDAEAVEEIRAYLEATAARYAPGTGREPTLRRDGARHYTGPRPERLEITITPEGDVIRLRSRAPGQAAQIRRSEAKKARRK